MIICVSFMMSAVVVNKNEYYLSLNIYFLYAYFNFLFLQRDGSGGVIHINNTNNNIIVK